MRTGNSRMRSRARAQPLSFGSLGSSLRYRLLSITSQVSHRPSRVSGAQSIHRYQSTKGKTQDQPGQEKLSLRRIAPQNIKARQQADTDQTCQTENRSAGKGQKTDDPASRRKPEEFVSSGATVAEVEEPPGKSAQKAAQQRGQRKTGGASPAQQAKPETTE